jgi:hypothetical protein
VQQRIACLKEKGMEISIDKQSKAVIVGVKGRMDAVTAPAFEDAMADHGQDLADPRR